MKNLLAAGAAALAASVSVAANAADLVDPVVFAPPPTVVTETFSWSGPYIGGSVGYLWGSRTSPSDLCAPLDPRDMNSDPALQPGVVEGTGNPNHNNETFFTDPDFMLDIGAETEAQYSCRPYEYFGGDFETNDAVGVFYDGTQNDNDSLLLGGFIGNNWQQGKLVLGLEAEASWIDSLSSTRMFNFVYFQNSDPLARSQVYGGGIFESDGPGWIATATARVGVAVGNAGKTLIYVKGGLAMGDKNQQLIRRREHVWSRP